MKILFYSIIKDKTEKTNRLIQRIRSLGHTLFTYNAYEDREDLFRLNNRHFQMYEKVLNNAEDLEVDLIYFNDYLNIPEYLLSEFKVRPAYKPKIVFPFQFRELNRSLARATALKDLIDMPQVARGFTFNMSLPRPTFPKNFIKAQFNMSKVKLIKEPRGENLPSITITKEEARKKFKIPQDKFVVLYSGRWIYVKGSDIFAEAIKNIDKDIFVLIHRDPNENDLDPNILNEVKKRKNLKVITGYLKEGEMSYLYKTADLVVASHRKMYEFSQSGIPVMASLAKVPLLAPNFSYFNDIIDTYRTGIKFTPESSQALAEGINFMKNNEDLHRRIRALGNFDGLINSYIDFIDVPKFALEDL